MLVRLSGMKTRTVRDVIVLLRENAQARRAAALIYDSQAAAYADELEAAKDEGLAIGLLVAAEELEELASELESEQNNLH